ncbi:MAG: hypothetical protein LDL39_07905 [Magnetospirillum sp.]|nr:hypothetical protein [Magnetospirillum sp.]
MPLITHYRHPALGPLLRLSDLFAAPVVLTSAEAATIARAVDAVRAGKSTETEIYLSPMASDQDFQALVDKDGVRCGGRHLDWPQVAELAALLRGE